MTNKTYYSIPTYKLDSTQNVSCYKKMIASCSFVVMSSYFYVCLDFCSDYASAFYLHYFGCIAMTVLF